MRGKSLYQGTTMSYRIGREQKEDVGDVYDSSGIYAIYEHAA